MFVYLFWFDLFFDSMIADGMKQYKKHILDIITVDQIYTVKSGYRIKVGQSNFVRI